MVSIASVLAMQPQLVIYDEPDANLDVRSLRRLIRFLQASRQTILVASHDELPASGWAHRRLELANGALTHG